MNRPMSVTVFGILNIFFAVFGFIGVLSLAAVLPMPHPANSSNPVIQLIHDNSAYAAWVGISAVLGIFSSNALLIAGIGLLKMRAWGRILSIICAVYSIVMVILGTIINYFFLVQPLLAQAKNQSGPQAAAAAGGAIGGFIGGCFGMIYPIFLLVFMLLPKVASAFRQPEVLQG